MLICNITHPSYLTLQSELFVTPFLNSIFILLFYIKFFERYFVSVTINIVLNNITTGFTPKYFKIDVRTLSAHEHIHTNVCVHHPADFCSSAELQTCDLRSFLRACRRSSTLRTLPFCILYFLEMYHASMCAGITAYVTNLL